MAQSLTSKISKLAQIYSIAAIIDTAKEVAVLISKSKGNITYLPGGDKSNVLLGVDNK